MPKYCPTCGNSSEKFRFFGNFCESCTKRKFSKGLPIIIEISRCKRCGKIKAGGSYVEPTTRSLEIAIGQQFGKNKVYLIKYEGNKAWLDVSSDTEYGTIATDHEVEIAYKKILCEMCYKKACNYHEAVIQLRGNPHRIGKFIEKISRYFDFNNEFISKLESADNGMDVYVSNKRMAAGFISRLKLHPTTSFTLAGVKNGKRIYKNTYALHFG